MPKIREVDYDPFAEDAEELGVAEDVAKSVAYRGIPEGLAARTVPGMALNAVSGIADLQRYVGDYSVPWVYNKFVGEDKELPVPLPHVAKNPIPNTSDILSGAANLAGTELYQPKTTPGEYANTASQFGSMGKNIKSIAGLTTSGLASEAAGQATEGTPYETPARIAAGVLTPMAREAFPSAPGQYVDSLKAKALGVNPERAMQLDIGGLPLSVPAVSDAPWVKSAANILAQLPGGGRLGKVMDAAFNKAESTVKSLGYTGTKTMTDAGNAVKGGFDRWKAESLKQFKNVDDHLKTVMPDDAAVNITKKPYTPEQLQSELGGAIDEYANLKDLQSHLQKQVEGKVKFSTRQLGFWRNRTQKDAAGDAISIQNVRKQITAQERKISGLEKLVDRENNTTYSTVSPQRAISSIINDKGLTPRQVAERGNHPAIIELKKLIDDAAQNDGNISFGALKEARTKIGQMLEWNPLMPTKSDAIAKRSYGAVSDLMGDAAEQVVGPSGRVLLEQRNRLYSLYADEQKSYIGKLQKKLGTDPEKIWTNLTSGDRVGASQAKRIFAKLNENEMGTVRDAWIRQKGMDRDGNFSVSNWAAKYKILSPEAKDAFFTGKPELRKAHESLIAALDNYKDVGKFGNPSRSGYTLLNPITKAATGGVGKAIVRAGEIGAVGTLAALNPIPALIIGGSSIGVNMALSRMLASPKYTRLLAKSLTEQPQWGLQKVNKVTALVKAGLIANGASQEDVDEALTPSPEAAPAAQLKQPSIREVDYDPFADEPANPPEPEIHPNDPGPGPQSALPPAIRANEGLRHTAYLDTTGNRTVGYGFNMDSGIARSAWKKARIPIPFDDVYNGNAAISDAHADALGRVSHETAVNDAMSLYPDLTDYSAPRKEALLDISYQLGKTRLKKFDRFNAAVRKGAWTDAVRHLKNSDYYIQVPERAKLNMRKLLRTS